MSPHKEIAAAHAAETGTRPGYWKIMAVCSALALADFLAGPHYAISVFFVLPVISAAWYQGLRFACAVGVGFSILRFLSHWYWGFPMEFNAAVVNNVLRSIALILVAILTDQLAAQMRKLGKREHQLEFHLPICPSCGIACRRDGEWGPLDDTTPLSTTTPPRTLCPDCEGKRYTLG